MKFVSYYYDKDPNKSTFYLDCNNKLKHNLNKFGYILDSENIDFSKMNLEAYDKLNLYKPEFILRKLEEHKEPVVWIDADTTVHTKLEEIETEEYDIIFAIREHDNKTPHAAIIGFNNTEKSKQFLLLWKKLCDEKKDDYQWKCTEHCLLVDLFKTLDSSYKILNLLNFASIGNRTKVNIGISPAGWEYERSK